MKKLMFLLAFALWPLAVQAQTPGAQPEFCVTSPSQTANYNQLCISASSSGGTVEVTNFGTATGSLNFPSTFFNFTSPNPITGNFLTGKNFNKILIQNDEVNGGNNQVTGLLFDYTFGSSTVTGPRVGAQFTLEHTSPTSASNTGKSYTALNIDVQSDQGDGGTGGGKLGSYFGAGIGVILLANATNVQEASGMEFNTQFFAGSSVGTKYGFKIVQVSNDAVAGSNFDSAIFMANQAGAVGWGTLLQIGDGINASPLKTSGSIMTVLGSPTIANGIDLSGAGTISGCAFKSPGGFCVDGSGDMLTAGFLSTTGGMYMLSASAPPSGGVTGAGYKFSSVSNFGIFFGTGNPTLSGAKGSLYLENGSGQLWINTSGSTTWTQVTVP